MDPTRDSAAYHGLLWCWCFIVLKEALPSFVDDNYKAIYSLWSYPAVMDCTKHIDPSKFGDNFTAFFTDAGIVCAKKTHQPRFQSIQEMDRMGIPEPLQLRMTGHKEKESTVHQKSYAHNPPSKCLVQRAGGDPEDQRFFNPVHFQLSTEEQ